MLVAEYYLLIVGNFTVLKNEAFTESQTRISCGLNCLSIDDCQVVYKENKQRCYFHDEGFEKDMRSAEYFSMSGLTYGKRKQKQEMTLSGTTSQLSGDSTVSVQTTRENKNTVYQKIKAGKQTLFIKLRRDRKSWSNAQLDCQSFAGRLVKLDTLEKVKALQKLFPIKDAIKQVYFWIGSSRENNGSNFYWTDGDLMDINRWAPNEPSGTYIDTKGRRMIPNCINVLYYFGKGLLFNDMVCTERWAYICERPILT